MQTRCSPGRAGSPVVGAGGAGSHGGVGLVCDEPVEVLVCDQLELLAVLLGQVATVCVEVSEEHHVLLVGTER